MSSHVAFGSVFSSAIARLRTARAMSAVTSRAQPPIALNAITSTHKDECLNGVP